MIARKTIAFNLIDPDQVRLLKHAQVRPNFSGYIKRLIQRDMEGGFFQQPLKTEESSLTRELVGGLI